MEIVQTVNEWKDTIKPALDSKVDEFRLMGYSKAKPEDIWNCLVQKVWKGNPDKRLHEIVQDVFHLGSNVYLSYLTVNAYQDDDLMASITALTSER
ncbi:post-transcriptional regulator [Virgibacillus sp. NKC19-16]|uniref:post-transcriptional regulator n=1 Tax=Virgibacillus salidurans TaxID=2831673 RepID=UPI001F317FD2|nr:post-transcriptional regulator [Virgibacillus sp. NKC19-16]UJL44943.1 post-transcriptional regulator [Virgibacillus sp. NKC19-16]